MKYVWLICWGLLIGSCQYPQQPTDEAEELIVATLKNETQYFCERNLSKWQDQWSHQSFVSKMYGGKGRIELYTGWEEVNQFTIDHIKQHPTPIPIPESDHEYEMHIFGEAALVLYAKTVEGKSVREVRFMVQEAGKWKIARMQTIF